jgi:hypothetical protein
VKLPDEALFTEVGREENLHAQLGVVQEVLQSIDHVVIARRISVVFVRVTVVRSSIGFGHCFFDWGRNLLQQAQIYPKL